MSRILIDLTDLQLWSGNHGGTQRVVYGIAKEFYLEQIQPLATDKVIFIAFSENEKRFYETSFQPIYDRVEAAHLQLSRPNTTAVISRKTQLKQMLRPYIPASIRQNEKAKRMAYKSLVLSKSKIVRARSFIKSKALTKVTIVSAGKLVDFKSDDNILMLGKPWDNLDIQSHLTAERSRLGFRLIQIVYDLIICLNPQLHHPSLFQQYTQHMFEAASASDIMLPISESSKRDLKLFCDRLNIPMPATQVLRLGDELESEKSRHTTKPDERIAASFVACIGTIEIRKNHSLLYSVYKLAAERNVELPQLVIVGSRGWLSGDLQYLIEHDPAMKEKILILDNVNDNGLAWVYQNCDYTVYPSMYEGWGLPVAESLAYGKVCLASNSSSVPEIAGELLDYFSPYNPEECLSVMVGYIQDPSLLESKQKRIVRQYQTTSWQQTYQQVRKSISK